MHLNKTRTYKAWYAILRNIAGSYENVDKKVIIVISFKLSLNHA